MSRANFSLAAILSATLLFGSNGSMEPLLQKIEKLEAFTLSSAVPIKFYDPFKRAASFVKKGKKRGFSSSPSLPRVLAVMNDRAFVNGRWVHAGDRVAGFKVAKIEGDGVVFKKGGTLRYVPVLKRKRVLKIKDFGE